MIAVAADGGDAGVVAAQMSIEPFGVSVTLIACSV